MGSECTRCHPVYTALPGENRTLLCPRHASVDALEESLEASRNREAKMEKYITHLKSNNRAVNTSHVNLERERDELRRNRNTAMRKLARGREIQRTLRAQNAELESKIAGSDKVLLIVDEKFTRLSEQNAELVAALENAVTIWHLLDKQDNETLDEFHDRNELCLQSCAALAKAKERG